VLDMLRGVMSLDASGWFSSSLSHWITPVKQREGACGGCSRRGRFFFVSCFTCISFFLASFCFPVSFFVYLSLCFFFFLYFFLRFVRTCASLYRSMLCRSVSVYLI
jgi:hypothetical protein